MNKKYWKPKKVLKQKHESIKAFSLDLKLPFQSSGQELNFSQIIVLRAESVLLTVLRENKRYCQSMRLRDQVSLKIFTEVESSLPIMSTKKGNPRILKLRKSIKFFGLVSTTPLSDYR